ncbi:glycosyltransferase [Brevibacillus sp. B_LB10_24]|uniref:glycosyltransferase n=1 Tax=Brevibacillus sp. B_LB10_24 TaxID=3380645 RepID=UPI0038B78C0F
MNREQTVSVIIPAQNEEETISAVIAEAKKLDPLEVIVVVNGSRDATGQIAKDTGCFVIEYPQALGNDVGRAVGAYHAKGEILLFLDGDIPIPGQQLLPFVTAVRQGSQIALNDLNWSARLPIRPHYTTVSKIATHYLLKKMTPDVNSLLAVPHALSRRALEAIGWQNLADPVVAMAAALEQNLSISAPVSIDVINRNKVRPVHLSAEEGSPFPRTTSRILGDHLAAIDRVMKTAGPRGGFTDGWRDRPFLETYVPAPGSRRVRRSAIVPVGEERATIAEVVASVRNVADEIIVVANGADRETIHKALEAGATVLRFAKRLGHNVGRAIGAAHSSGEVLLFVDGDFVIPPQDLIPFVEAAEQGTDIALNDLQKLLDLFHPIDAVSSVKYFLNMAVKRPDLLNNSLTAVPHAIHRRVIDRLGYRMLMLPPLAQVMAILAGYSIAAVHYVDVVGPNRLRPEHQRQNGRLPAFDRIYGDHVEALHYLLSKTDARGGFHDGGRDRQLIETLQRRN